MKFINIFIDNSILLRRGPAKRPVFPVFFDSSIEHNIYLRNTDKTRVSNGFETLQVRINKELLSNVIQFRELRKKYITNRTLREVAVFCVLKTVTSSGIIQNYIEQLDDLAELCNCSKSSLFGIIKRLIDQKLIARKGGALILRSMQRLLNRYEITSKETVSLTYEFRNHKLYQLLQAAYIKSMRSGQEFMVNKKIQNNPYLKHIINEKSKNPERIRKKLLSLQISTFKDKSTTDEYELIHSINADTNLSARSLRRAFKFKSNMSVAYLKKMLGKRGIAKITVRKIESTTRSRKGKNYFVEWFPTSKQTRWRLTDDVQFLPVF